MKWGLSLYCESHMRKTWHDMTFPLRVDGFNPYSPIIAQYFCGSDHLNVFTPALDGNICKKFYGIWWSKLASFWCPKHPFGPKHWNQIVVPIHHFLLVNFVWRFNPTGPWLVGWLATCGNTQDGFLGTITTQFRSRPSDGLGEAEMRPEVGWLAKQIPLFISCI